MFSPTECKPCECGKDSNCTFDGHWLWKTKTCLCKVGYEERNGFCKDLCNPNPCENGGTCSVSNGRVTCKCNDPYTGDNCATDLCDPNPCKNGGTCSASNGKVTCKCNAPYRDDNCATDFCLPNPCKNGGECLRNSSTCLCLPGYFGVYCEQCKCKNGFCKENDKGIVVCTCPSEWGKESPTECKPCECGKDSNCTFEGGWFWITKTCLCIVGYEDINGFCKEIPSSSTTTPEEIASITSTDSSSVLSGGPTRNLFTAFPPRPSAVDDLNKSTQWINLNVTTIFPKNISTPISTTERLPRDHSLNFTRERGSTVHLTTATASTAVDLCAVNPCKNGGICRMEGNMARCYCISPFTGKLCEKDPCLLNPCVNGGQCKVNGTSFQCKCGFPYSGRFCENDPCSENLCKNGGSCFVTGDSFKCLCKAPYAGILCETDPCVWNPCKNGGICKIEIEAVKCFCKESFTGEFCDSLKYFDTYIIALAAASGILVIVAILLFCLLCQSGNLPGKVGHPCLRHCEHGHNSADLTYSAQLQQKRFLSYQDTCDQWRN